MTQESGFVLYAPQHILSSVLPPERIVFTYDNAREA